MGNLATCCTDRLKSDTTVGSSILEKQSLKKAKAERKVTITTEDEIKQTEIDLKKSIIEQQKWHLKSAKEIKYHIK